MNEMIDEIIGRLGRMLDEGRGLDIKSASGSHIDEERVLSSLLSIDNMLCNSAVIARLRFSDDANHLLQIIGTSHIGLETLLAEMNVQAIRSEVGSDFNPEYMQAQQTLIPTDDAAMHGKVAVSVTPRFVQVGNDGRPEAILQMECVMLYNKQED